MKRQVDVKKVVSKKKFTEYDMGIQDQKFYIPPTGGEPHTSGSNLYGGGSHDEDHLAFLTQMR